MIVYECAHFTLTILSILSAKTKEVFTAFPHFDFTKLILGKPTLTADGKALCRITVRKKDLFSVLSGLYQKHLKICKTSKLL